MKYKKTLELITIISFLIFFTSCSHFYYTPNSQTIPLFQKKGEARISAATYGSEESEGFVINTAFSVTNHIGIMGNYMYGDAENNLDWGKGDFYEIGIGYFESPSPHSVFECYTGYGLGYVENQYDWGVQSSVNYSRYFIQPSFGLTSKIIEIAVSGRLCRLNYYHIEYDSELINDYHFEDIEYIINQKNFLLFEPALTLRIGSENFKIQAQVVSSDNLTNSNLQQEKINFNIGFIIKF